NSYPREAVDLDVEGAVPGQHADEAACRRIAREVARVDLVDRGEVDGVGAIDVTLEDFLKRGAGCGEAELDLVELDFHLTYDRKRFDLAGLGIVGRDVRHEHHIAASDAR